MTGKNIKDTIGVVNPHDKLIREVYSDRDNARSFLVNHLPGKVLDLVEISTLEISKDSFIGQDLASAYQTTQGKIYPVAHCDTAVDLPWQAGMARMNCL